MGSEMARATTAEMARRCRGWEKALLDSGDEIGAEEHHHWADRLTELAAEVERLRGKLPKTADGVDVIDLDGCLWYDDGKGINQLWLAKSDGQWYAETVGGYRDSTPISHCYSTRAAAEAARNADNKPATEA